MDILKDLARLQRNASRGRAKKEFHGEISRNETKRKAIHRVPGRNELNILASEAAKSPNHHSIFCTHNMLYWAPCTKCGRTKEMAEKNITIVLRSVSGQAFHS